MLIYVNVTNLFLNTTCIDLVFFRIAEVSEFADVSFYQFEYYYIQTG